MKIALITYHYSTNHGAIMQTYALCKFLIDKGYDMEIIDIRQDENWEVPIHIKVAKYLIQKRRINNFIKENYPTLTHRYASIDELRKDPPKADCFLVGSDQTWNPLISKENFLAYFLDFGDNKKRISYASSFGLKEWPQEYSNYIPNVMKCLERFSSISVREHEGASLCSKTFGIDPVVVLDPTFLNDSYQNLVGKIKNRNEIVCYKLNKTPDFFHNVQELSKVFNLPLLLLNNNYPIKGFKYCFNTSTQQWLRRIAGAKFVFTDSFHGIAFSILFRKQFAATLNHNGRDSRLISLMSMAGLSDRLFDSTEDLVKNIGRLEQIDYDKVFEKLKPEIENSRIYLLKALQ